MDDERAFSLLRDADVVKGAFRDRSEQEFAGYRDATDHLMGTEPERLSLGFVLHVHRLLMRHTGDPLAGRLKASDNLIGDREGDGRVTVVFKTVAAGSQTEWHLTEAIDRYEGDHDLWPWTGYLLRILEDAYGDFERLVTAGRQPIGATKAEQARIYIVEQAPRTFSLAQIAHALPDISQATIRNALETLKTEGLVEAGRGRSAVWRRLDPPGQEQ